MEPLDEMYYKKKIYKKKGRSYIQYKHSYLYLKESGVNPHYDESNVQVRVTHPVTTLTTVE